MCTNIHASWGDILDMFCCMQMVMKSSLCDTLYVTDVLAEFEADTFFPPIDTTVYQLLK